MMKVVSFADPPFVAECFEQAWRGNGCPMPGIEIEYIGMLLTMLQLPFTLSAMNSSSDVQVAITNGSATIAGNAAPLTPELQASFEVTYPVIVDKSALIIRKEVQEAVQSSFLASADWNTWVAIVVTTGVLGLFARFVSRVLQLPMAKQMTSLTFVFWSIIGGFLLDTGASFMTVNLVTPTTTTVELLSSIADLRTCVLARTCHLVYHSAYINTSVHENFFRVAGLNQSLLTNQGLIGTVNTREELAEFVAADSHNVGLDFESVTDFYTVNYCKLKVKSFPEVASILFVFYSNNKSLINQLSRLQAANPLQQYYCFLLRKYMTRGEMKNRCDERPESVQFKPISLIKLADAFFFLLGGNMAAGVTLLWQRWKHLRRDRSYMLPI
jgi:hypothetical protein